MARQPVHASLGHLRIEIIETRALLGLGRSSWRWRTVYVQNGQIGVWSEPYTSREACERSIRGHRHYLGSAPVRVKRADGGFETVEKWS